MPTETKKLSFKTRKTWSNQVAQENWEILNEYYPHCFSWRKNAVKLERARFNRHFSEAEHNEILNFRQAPLPIGISTAIMDSADALFVNKNPIVSVSPIIFPDDSRTERSRNIAGIYKHLIQNSWHQSMGALQYARSIFDAGNVGHSFMHIMPRHEYGEFTVDAKWLSWKFFIPDPSSKDILYDDMDNHVYARPLTLKQAYRMIKAIEPDLKYDEFKKEWKGDGSGLMGLGKFEADPVTGELNGKDHIMFIYRTTLEEETHYIIIPKTNKYGEAGFKYSTSMEYTDDMKKQVAEGLIEVHERRKLSLTEYSSFGAYGYKVAYPVNCRNIIPIKEQYGDTPYPYSRMWYLYPLQRALNRAIMSSLLNMSLMNATRVIAEENSIVNMKEWIMNASMPGAVLRYQLPVPGVSKPPEIVKAEPMGEAWLAFPRFIISMMEYVSGMFGIQQGNPDTAPDAFGSMASLQSIANQRVKSKSAMLDASLSKVGQVIAEFYKEYAPSDGYSSYRDPVEDAERITQYNKLVPKVQVGENGTNISADVEVDPTTDLKVGIKEVRFTTQASLGNEAVTEAAMLTTLSTQSGLPMQAIAPLILQRLNVKGVDKIMESIDQRGQMQATIQQQQEMIKELDGKTKIYQNQIFQLVKGLEAARAKGLLDVELTKLKTDPIGYLNQAMTNQGDH